jgi:flagellar biosynthesis/type III secretory pathway chaperone
VNNSLAGLVDALNEKNVKLSHLKTILEEEREHICRFRSVELEAINRNKEKLIEEIKTVRKCVGTALAECCRKHGLPAESGLTALIERLPEPQKSELSALRDSLVTLSGNIGQLLAANRGLLESGLSILNRSIGFFRRVFSKSDTYGSSGQMMEAPSTRLICKEI